MAEGFHLQLQRRRPRGIRDDSHSKALLCSVVRASRQLCGEILIGRRDPYRIGFTPADTARRPPRRIY